MRRRWIVPAMAAVLGAGALRAADEDVVLHAMLDELSRSRALKVMSLETPYFIQYGIDDGDSFSVSATLGGVVTRRDARFRVPEIRVRVGSYKFDNSNYIGSGYRFGPRYAVEQFPVDNSYEVLRRDLWLATDSAYKSAVEAISRKRAALKNIAQTDNLDDFAPAEPVEMVLPQRHPALDRDAWTARIRALSGVFTQYPQLRSSAVELEAVDSVHYLVNTEGTELRDPETLIFIRMRAEQQAPDGMLMHDAVSFQSLDFNRIDPVPDLERGARKLAENVTALARAPKGEDYTGPVLFEGKGAAQLFAEVLGRNLALTRRPVGEPGRPGMFVPSDLEGRQGSRVLPEWMDVVDDPTQKEWHGHRLFGSYDVDQEGVIPKPLVLVDQGVLKNFLLTRQPMRGFSGSNGRARLPGNFGASAAGPSNLFISAHQTVTRDQLKSKLMQAIQARGKPYGMLVREMDFPSSASLDDLRRMFAGASGGGRPVSLPILVYRVYPDGREELVRGLRFRGLDVRSLKDILAAGDDNNIFEYLENGALFAMAGAGSFVAETSVVAPSVLIDDVELHPVEAELPKLPLVPPPGLGRGDQATGRRGD